MVQEGTGPADVIVNGELAVAVGVNDVHEGLDERHIALVERFRCLQQAGGERGLVLGFADLSVGIGVGHRGKVLPQLEQQLREPLPGRRVRREAELLTGPLRRRLEVLALDVSVTIVVIGAEPPGQLFVQKC